jgi:hypothetical protein
VSEFATTSIRGLPGPLPPGESLLWQGAPDWWSLARHAFHIRGLGLYFAAVLLARGIAAAGSGASPVEAAVAVLWLAPVALAGLGLVLLFAWLIERTTVYTLTSRRLVLHIGIALPVTFNLPFKRIGGAAVRRYADGTGDIPLLLTGSDRIAYLHLWPHARPWRVKRPEPMLRAVPDADRVAELLADAINGLSVAAERNIRREAAPAPAAAMADAA